MGNYVIAMVDLILEKSKEKNKNILITSNDVVFLLHTIKPIIEDKISFITSFEDPEFKFPSGSRIFLREYDRDKLLSTEWNYIWADGTDFESIRLLKARLRKKSVDANKNELFLSWSC